MRGGSSMPEHVWGGGESDLFLHMNQYLWLPTGCTPLFAQVGWQRITGCHALIRFKGLVNPGLWEPPGRTKAHNASTIPTPTHSHNNRSGGRAVQPDGGCGKHGQGVSCQSQICVCSRFDKVRANSKGLQPLPATHLFDAHLRLSNHNPAESSRLPSQRRN